MRKQIKGKSKLIITMLKKTFKMLGQNLTHKPKVLLQRAIYLDYCLNWEILWAGTRNCMKRMRRSNKLLSLSWN
jgi:hypothetical protein